MRIRNHSDVQPVVEMLVIVSTDGRPTAEGHISDCWGQLPH